MLSPPGQWARWCWQGVRVRAARPGASLQSAVASPSGASWACGQLAAFPGGSEPSAGPCQEEKRKTKEAKILELKPHRPHCNPSDVLFSGTPRSTQSSWSWSRSDTISLACQPRLPTFQHLPGWAPYLVSFVATNTTGLGASAGFSF